MKLNSIFVSHHKNTENEQTTPFPIPAQVVIPMAQGMGAACSPVVKKGDTVKVGQLIGQTTAFMSAPIYSSVSGTVNRIDKLMTISGKYVDTIVIDTDGQQTADENIKPPKVSDKASFIEAIKQSGLVGLGGAGFPTHIKLNIDQAKTPVDSLVINAAECEPFITSDYRQMMEAPDDIINGIKTVMKYLEIKNAYIGIEDNKPQAIKLLKETAKNNPEIKIVSLKSSYPQGAEKVISYYCTGRIIGDGEIPINQGIIVMNVSSVAFVHSFLQTGMPLVSRRLTVSGDAVSKPTNLIVPIGTKISDLLTYTNTDPEKITKLINGGIMMGQTLYDIDYPVTKTTNAVLALTEKLCDGTGGEPSNCIRCGRCIQACPLGLMPRNFEQAYINHDIEELEKLNITLCMNCGSCTYVCPAKRQISQTNQLAKALVMQERKNKK